MKKPNGFTLFELVVVILIIGILAVVALPTWQGSSLSLEYQARQILADIRFAQAMSMTSDQRYRWVKVSSTSYQILNEAGSAIILPSGSTTATLTNGVSIGTLSNLPNSLVAFDSQGIPYTTSSYPGTALASTASITISGGSTSHTIQISPTTGYGVLQ